MALNSKTKHLPLSSDWIDIPTVDSFTTADAYADVGIWDTEFLLTKNISFACTSHNVKVIIYGSLDGGVTYPHIVEAEFTLVAAADPIIKTIDGQWTKLKIQSKSATAGAGNTGDLTVKPFGSNAPNMSDVTVTATVSPVISGPLDRKADASSISTALSTEDVALLQVVIDRLGALTTPATGSVNAQLATLATSAKQDTGNLSFATIAKRYSQPTPVTINISASGDSTIISAPTAGHQIVIYSMFMTCLVNNLVILKKGSTEMGRAYVYGFSKDYISGLPLGDANAFVVNAATNDLIQGQVIYVVETL
jgi:hypothetical protein